MGHFLEDDIPPDALDGESDTDITPGYPITDGGIFSGVKRSPGEDSQVRDFTYLPCPCSSRFLVCQRWAGQVERCSQRYPHLQKAQT